MPAPAGRAGISTIETAGPGSLPDRWVEPPSALLGKPAVAPGAGEPDPGAQCREYYG